MFHTPSNPASLSVDTRSNHLALPLRRYFTHLYMVDIARRRASTSSSIRQIAHVQPQLTTRLSSWLIPETLSPAT